VSVAGVLALVAACGLVLTAGAGAGRTAGLGEMAIMRTGWLESCSLSIFCCAGHGCFPMLFTGVREDKREYMRALTFGGATYFACAVAFGAGGYYVYGRSAQPIAIANVGRDFKWQPVSVPLCVVVALNLLIMFKCQLQLVPLSRPVVALIHKESSSGGVLAALASAPVLFVVWLISMVAYESMDTVMNLVSGVLCSLNAFIFPPLAFLLLCKPDGLPRAVAVLVCAGGVVFGVMWTTKTCISVSNEFPNFHEY
jgi:hypothetical protein